jgi:pimeloyl-ACP methyl ester carboxylesterase
MDDVSITERVINAQSGPVVLVGHSWGGTVITQAGANPKVKALVYVAAFAPGPGENSLDGVKTFPPSPGLAQPIVDASGFLTLSTEAINDYFAQDVSTQQANLIATTQGAVRGINFEETVSSSAWQSKPSWYIVAAKDHMIHPDAQRAYAKKINATVTTLATSHVPMLSKPREVAAVILQAAESAR